jgi:kynurenine formamidase
MDAPSGIDDQPPTTAPGLDRIGTRQRLDAIHGVRTGKVYDLGTEYGHGIPQGAPDTFPGFRLTPYRTPRGLTADAGPDFDFSMELIVASPHHGSHIDGLAHISSEGRQFGGHAIADIYGDFGWTKNGIETTPPILGRGVLLDMPRAMGVDQLPADLDLQPEDLEACLDSQKTELRSGDTVLIRTGKFAADFHARPDEYFAHAPGVGPDAAIWLYDRGMALLGTDTGGTEAFVDVTHTTHKVLLVERGVQILEVLDLEELARDQVTEFLFICLPLKISGATGSWVRPVAVI